MSGDVQKSDRDDNNAARRGRSNVIADIRFEPRLGRRAAAALKNQDRVAQTERIVHLPASVPELLLIRARMGHRQRNAMRGVNDVGTGQLSLRLAHTIDDGLDKAGMIPERRHFIDPRRVRNCGSCRIQILTILAAA